MYLVGIADLQKMQRCYLGKDSDSQSSDGSNSTEIPVTTESKRRITNSCFTASLPDDAPSNIKITDTSSTNSCQFIVQFEGLGDSPIAVGEVFSGNYPLQEILNLIPDELNKGFELDLIDLGPLRLLSTGRYSSLKILYQNDDTINGQQAIFYTHDSNRSISGQANSAVIVAPIGATVGDKQASTLLVWGVSNNRNRDLMEKLLKTVVWN